jgi:hypothetical protein
MSSRSRRLLVGVRIEGIGQDSALGGLCYYWSSGAPPVLPAGLTLQWRQGLTRPPQGVSTSIDVWTGRWQISAISLTLSYAHAPQLLASQTVTDVELVVALDGAATDVELSTPALGGRAVWIEDEVILLGSWGGSSYTGCVRGLWGSQPAPHTAGQPAFVRPRSWDLRVVELYSLDLDTGVEQLRWRGYLSSRKTSPDGTAVEIGCEEHFAVWRRGQANRAPVNLNAGGALRVNRSGQVYGNLTDADGQPARISALSAAAIAAGVAGVGAQVGGALVPLDYDPATGRAYLRVSFGARLGSTVEAEPAGDQSAYTAYTEPVWETIAWDRPGDLDRPPGERPLSPTWGTPTAWHPLRIAQILLRASGEGSADPLGRAWGLGLDHVDWSAWDKAIESKPGLQIDQVLPTWDGEPYKPLEVAEQLLRALGYYLAPQLSGTLTIRRLTTLTLAGYAEARAQRTTIYPGTLELVPAPDVGLTELTATVGETPFDQARRVRVSARGSSPRAAYLSDARRWEVQLPYWRQSEAVRLALELSEGASLVHYSLPRLKVRVPDPQLTGIDCSIGRYITLDPEGLKTAWVLDRNGLLIPSSDIPTRIDLVGLVVGVKIGWEDLTHELEVLLIAWHTGSYARDRAPEAEFTSISGLELECETVYGYATGDVDAFEVGDQVVLCSYTGEILEGPYTVTDVYGVFLELDSAPTTPEGIVQLAESGSYANTARYSFEARPYVYYSEAGQIDRPIPIYYDPPDQYGGGLGVG